MRILIAEERFDEFMINSVCEWFDTNTPSNYVLNYAFDDPKLLEKLFETKEGIISVEFPNQILQWDKTVDGHSVDGNTKTEYTAYWWHTVMNLRTLGRVNNSLKKINGTRDMLQLNGIIRKLLSNNRFLPIKDYTVPASPIVTDLKFEWRYADRQKPVTSTMIPTKQGEYPQTVFEIPVWVKIMKAETGDIVLDRTLNVHHENIPTS